MHSTSGPHRRQRGKGERPSLSGTSEKSIPPPYQESTSASPHVPHRTASSHSFTAQPHRTCLIAHASPRMPHRKTHTSPCVRRPATPKQPRGTCRSPGKTAPIRMRGATTRQAAVHAHARQDASAGARSTNLFATERARHAPPQSRAPSRLPRQRRRSQASGNWEAIPTWPRVCSQTAKPWTTRSPTK